MGIADNINSPDDLWAYITSCFSTSGYVAHGFFNWGYRRGTYAQGSNQEEQALELTSRTVWGHFSALMAWFKLSNQDPNWTDDNQWLSNWASEQQKMYFNMDNINTRRYKNDTTFSFKDFFTWLKSQSQDATQEVYDWYPATRLAGWKAPLGPAKYYPGLLIIDAKGNAPNQYNPKGPVIQYTYNAGRKNAVTNTMLIASSTTVVKDYAKYKATPGWRGQPYDTSQIYGSVPCPKLPFQDWIDEMVNNKSQGWITYSAAQTPIFNKLVSTMGVATANLQPIPTINYDYRYYDFLN
jgi:hypothetical protein